MRNELLSPARAESFRSVDHTQFYLLRGAGLLALLLFGTWLYHGALISRPPELGFLVALSLVTLSVMAIGYWETRDSFAPTVTVPAAVWLLFVAGYEAANRLFGTTDDLFFLVSMAIVGLSFGMLLVPSGGQLRRRERFCAPHPSVIYVLLLTTFLMGCVGLLGIVAQSGVPLLAPEVAEYRFEAQENARFFGYFSLLLRNFQVFIYLGAAAAFAGVIRQRTIVYAGMVCALAGLALIGNRGLVLFPLITVAVLYHESRRHLSFAQLVLLAAVLILIAGFLGYLRSSGGYGVSTQTVALRAIHEIAIPAYNLDVVMRIFPRQHSYMLGAGFLSPLSTILPGRQLLLDWRLKELSGLTFVGGGLPPTSIGTFYIDFGVPGVLLGGTLLGGGIAWLYGQFRRTRSLTWLLTFAIGLEQVITGFRNMISLDAFLVYVAGLLFVLGFAERQQVRVRRLWAPADPRTTRSTAGPSEAAWE